MSSAGEQPGASEVHEGDIEVEPSVPQNGSLGGTACIASGKPAEVVVKDIDDAIEVLRTVIEHDDPLFYVSILLGTAQDHVIQLLGTVFYVAFTGATGSGKSTAVRACMAITRDGVVLSQASMPVLRDIIGRSTAPNRAVGIVQSESTLQKDSPILALVLNGQQRATANVPLKVASGKDWVTIEIDA